MHYVNGKKVLKKYFFGLAFFIFVSTICECISECKRAPAFYIKLNKRERSEFMGDLKETIMEELNCETVFTIHIGNFNIPIAESTVITWVIMAILLVLCIFLTRGLKVKNVSKRQLVAESIVGWLEKFVIGMTGEEGKAFVPYLCSVLLYIGFANLIGLCGVKPPTKDLNVTAALAVMSIVLVQYAGIHKKGFKGWLKSFTQPMAIVTPINILELFIKPLSLCMRLFGNVLGALIWSLRA